MLTTTTTTIDDVLTAAAAARDQAPAPGDDRYGAYCSELARCLAEQWDDVCDANAQDVARARASGLSADLVGRLTLSESHLDMLVALAQETRGLLPQLTRQAAARPAGEGMTVRRIPKPLGVILMIYEARPTVTIEGALLPVAVGNVAILRGGSEMQATSAALGDVAADAASAAGLPEGIVQVLADTDRRVVRELIARHDVIDALIPRGSPALIDYCLAKSTIPVIASGGGVNHLYVDSSADVELAATIALDSKLTEPTACNALEIVLVHEAVARSLTEALLRRSNGESEPWVLRLDPRLAGNLDAGAVASADRATTIAELSPHDDGREFLDRSIGVRPVADVAGAIEHIRRHGSRHTEGIVARDPLAVEQFLGSLDAAGLVVNGSLRLHDGPTMSLGPELSISTGRLHVRGPVDIAALLTYSWVIDANGAVRGAGRAP
jgi:glutamate-5-semialdehyde dehydrogenase